jgi:hypothetical protein
MSPILMPQPYAIRVGAALVLLCDPQAIFCDAHNHVLSCDPAVPHSAVPNFAESLVKAPFAASVSAL